jgi:ChrR Cupin-like domain
VLVIDRCPNGVFQDEHGNFPAGSYIRNPPESRHTPGSAPGCTIFVKLWQFDLADRTHVRIDTNTMAFAPDPGRPGVEVMPLFHDANEDVRLERWAPGSTIVLDEAGGAEILVLDGRFTERDEIFEEHSWLRLPSHWRAQVQPAEQGALPSLPPRENGEPRVARTLISSVRLTSQFPVAQAASLPMNTCNGRWSN